MTGGDLKHKYDPKHKYMSGSKRGHSASLLISSSKGPQAKRGKSNDNIEPRKVSFGHLTETVHFNKTDSSSNLSLGVSVSELSFGSSGSSQSLGNFRWETNITSSPSNQSNAAWGAPPAPRDSRWKSFDSPNIFQSSQPPTQPNCAALTNAMHVLSVQRSITPFTPQQQQQQQQQ